MRISALLFSAMLTGPLLAQHGDKAGETQPQLPAHIAVPPAPILTVEEAIATFHVPRGFRLEIVAADPLIHDPVAITFGPDGRIWVAEMSGFMPNADGKGEDAKVGSIAVLEDTDGDGRMDKRTVFLDGLVLPRAIALVAGGVLVAEPPTLWFCPDANGDGVADKKIAIATDYGNPANPEHSANGLMPALDNWIYSANHTTRLRDEGGGHFTREATVTRGQWGLSQDDTGRLYHNNNSDPLRADLVPSAYLTRNPHLKNPAGTNVQLAPANLAIWPSRPTPGVNRGYKNLNPEGKITAVTAACGPVIYRGSLFPAEYAGNAFIAEPSGNFIKRIILTEAAGTITGRNAQIGTEFFSSTDERFRPVNLANGPDGALYIVDLYRGIIQHRIYMTSFLRQQVDDRGLAEGLGLGRIYRLVPENTVRVNVKFNLAAASTAQLVNHLRAPSGWWRDTAQRLLVERRDPAATPLLRALACSAEDAPLARLHALWTLQGCAQLDRATVLTALASPNPNVAAAAIRLAEQWLTAEGGAEIVTRIIQLNSSASPVLTLQQALSLGPVDSPAALTALVAIAARAGHQPFVADALVSGLKGRELDFIQLAGSSAEPTAAAPAITLAASAVLQSGDRDKITRLLNHLEPRTGFPAWGRTALLAGIKYFLPKTPDGQAITGGLPVEPRALLNLANANPTPEGQAAGNLLSLLRWPGKPGLEKEIAALAPHLNPAQQALFEKGRTLFATICAACHQPNGEGLAGLAPPLLYSRYVLGSEQALARIVLNGKTGGGLMMPPLRTLDDESLAAALTYARSSWGHAATPVTPTTITAVRRKIGQREEPWSDEELQSLAD